MMLIRSTTQRLQPLSTTGCSFLAVKLITRGVRQFSSSRTFSSGAQPVVELCEDRLFPQHAATYIGIVTGAAHPSRGAARTAPFPPLCFLTVPQLGGTLNVATRAYYYEGGLSEWQETQTRLSQDPAMQAHVALLRPYIQSQESSLFVEAPLVRQSNLPGLAAAAAVAPSQGGIAAETPSDRGGGAGGCCILELRRYRLRLGYDTVPKFLDLYGTGLPSKLASTDPTTSLVTLLYSEVGRLNEVIEVWRHGDGVDAMERSRAAARRAKEWRDAIGSIAELAIEFRSTIHRPLPSSPIR